MQLPLNVLLYRLSPNSRYDIQNTDLSCRFDGIQLFDANETLNEDQKFLYLVSETMLRGYADKFLHEQLLSKCVFLCIPSDKDTSILDLNHNLSVILLHTKDSFPLIFNKILNIFREFDEWDKSFHLTLLQGGTLQELLNISSSILVHPMIVFDRNYSILGYLRSPDVSDPFMEQMIKTGYATPEDILKLREDGLISASEHSDNPLINWYCLPDQNCYYSIMYRFRANRHIVGYALIFCCTKHPNTNYLDLMGTVCENLELYFHQDRFTSRSSSEIYEPILTEILEHPELPAKQLQDQIRHIPDLSINGNFVLSKVAYSEVHKLPFSFVSWNLRNSIPSLKPFVYQNFLYILRDNCQQNDCTCFLNDKEQKIFDEIFDCHLLTCGISQTFFSLADLPMAATQCREAVLLGSQLFTDSRKFFKFEDVAIYYFLRESGKSVPLPMIASPYYHLLKQYDEEHNNDLCELFYTFLLNGRNVNQTSAAIFMHRNTVLNKIKKASAIMNNDFNDYQTQLYYIISYLSDRSPLLN